MGKLKTIITKDAHKKQVTKFLYAAIACIGLLLIVEGLFQVPAINNLFDEESIGSAVGITAWAVLWLLMFAQVTIIPIPAMPILVFCNNTNLVATGPELLDLFSLRTLFFAAFVTSACYAGSAVAYWLGRAGGGKAVKWIAGDEEEYKHWCQIFNRRDGKIIYAATVILPIFPDDLLCLVMGAMKMNFRDFTFINISLRFIATIAFMGFLRLPYVSDFFKSSVNGGFPWSILVYSVLLVLCIVTLIVWKIKVDKKSV